MDTFIRNPGEFIFSGVFYFGQIGRNNPSPQGSLLGHAVFRFVTSNNSKRNSGGNHRRPKMNFLGKAIVICGLIAGLAVPTFADEGKSAGKSEKSVKAEKSEKKAEGRNVIKTESKEITGQVSAISKDYIAVIYQTGKNSENEMGIYIEGFPKLERVKDFAQIQAGDTVTVEYDVATEKDKDDNESARHVVKKIIFVKKAPPPPPETDVMISDEAEE
jgi:hypothetical protein